MYDLMKYWLKGETFLAREKFDIFAQLHTVQIMKFSIKYFFNKCDGFGHTYRRNP